MLRSGATPRQMKPKSNDNVKYTGYQTHFRREEEKYDAREDRAVITCSTPKNISTTSRSLLSCGPHLVHSRLDVVGVGLCALWPPNIRTWIVHLAHWRRRAISVRIWVHVAIALRRRRHVVGRGRPTRATHMRATTSTSRLALFPAGWWLENRWWAITSRMRRWSHAIGERSCGWRWLVWDVIFTTEMPWQWTVIHVLILCWVTRHMVHRCKLRIW